jgi:hypothetical protein
MSEKIGFFKAHGDTIAIIGVNIAMITILVSMCISNTHRIDASNARSDFLSNQIIELIKEVRK